ncbi:hypothetical protein ARTHRO9AX_80138 [Arthrobacter sp. 9AX]|nr:hypothetical protein ARTHRO9AX_80138 [Arthrobacter sp. 9AX]
MKTTRSCRRHFRRWWITIFPVQSRAEPLCAHQHSGPQTEKIQTLTGYDPLRLNNLLELALALRYRNLTRGDIERL